MGHISKRALLINPPIYDVQYWAEWSQPQGLLKIGTFLKNNGYETYLIDCLYPNQKRNVPKKIKSVVEIGSTPLEISLNDFRKDQSRLKQNQRYKYIFGINLDDLRKDLLTLAGLTEVDLGKKILTRSLNIFPEESFHPDEIWITSIMTYWWESTVDVAVLCKEIFPSALIRIGGIYPTLAPNHLASKLAARGLNFEVVFGYLFDLTSDRDVVVVGEIPEASWLDLDLDLYYQPYVQNSRYYHGPIVGEPGHESAVVDRRYYVPSYAILTTTRGCPFNCAYCAQHAYNLYDNKQIKELLWTDERGRKKAVRTRGSEITLNEIRDKFHRYGIRQFAFYEDNFLIEKNHFKEILEGIVNDHELHGNVHLHAPEGIEVRLIDDTLADLMFKAGFERVYLPLENINNKITKSWNRSHSNVKMFERAVQNCIEAGFRLRNMELNTFILFGTPGENILDVVDSAIYASSRIGSVIPMLFTPVPGSALYDEFEEYMLKEMEYDLQHLNGKFFPFLELNRRIYPELSLQDYLNLEGLMFRLNAQAIRGTFDIGGNDRIAESFRRIVYSRSTNFQHHKVDRE